MSLLNDMLQDLQQQPGQNREISDDGNRAQLNESGMIKTTSVPWLISVVVFIVVLSSLLVVKQIYKSQPEKNIDLSESLAAVPSPSENPVVTEVVPDAPQELEILPLSPEVVSTSMESKTQSVITQIPSLDSAEQEKIDQLLMLARQAIARDRLTSPFEDNAYTYYQQILALEPGNLLATQGVLQLADRYLAMADKKLVTGDREAAHRLVQRAQLVAPEYSAVIEFAGQWQGYFEQTATAMEPEASNDLHINTSIDSSVTSAGQSVQSQGQPQVQLSADSVSIRDPFNPSAEESHLSVSPNLQWQDQQQVQNARLLLQQKKIAQAIAVLEEFIATNSESQESTRLLLDIYCEQARVEDAQRILAYATYLEKIDQHFYKAKLALLNNQIQEAMDLLEAELSVAEKHEQYRALLAGIYQKAAHYPQAATSYKRLLEVFGEKPAYWLGYALALDALEQKASALQAYRRLSEYTGLKTEVRAYVEQRIAALQG